MSFLQLHHVFCLVIVKRPAVEVNYSVYSSCNNESYLAY